MSQPEFDDPRYNGINPYALGFAMMQDIQRICVAPTAEDREWFPDFAGSGDCAAVLRDIWANYRDESLRTAVPLPAPHPPVPDVRAAPTRPTEPMSQVDAIHDAEGYPACGRLAERYDSRAHEPDIQVVDVDFLGDRPLVLRHTTHNGVGLAEVGREATLRHIRRLWGYEVRLQEA